MFTSNKQCVIVLGVMVHGCGGQARDGEPGDGLAGSSADLATHARQLQLHVHGTLENLVKKLTS